MRSLTSSLLFTLSIFTIANPSLADTGVCHFFNLPSFLADLKKTNECQKGDTAFWSFYKKDRLDQTQTEQFVAEACDLNEKIIQGTNDWDDPDSKYVVCTYAPKVFRDVGAY